jgi:mitochondrial chaperone BCS1
MVVDSLLESAFHNAGNISSSNSVPGLSLTTLVEKVVPGYDLIHKFLLVAFDFDVTILVSVGVVLWLGARIFRLVWAAIRDLVYNNYVSEITINSVDGIYAHLMAFLAYQYKFNSSRRLIAETLSKSTWELDSEDIKTKESTVDVEGKIKWQNFANQEAKSQPRYNPAIGSHNFWHKRTYFQLRRKEVAMFDELGSGAATFKDKELLTLSCFGRSTEPIKKLIQDAKEHYHQTHNAKTVIKRPAHKDLRKRGGNWSWRTQAERPCRPMKTVDLDHKKKEDILADINEYLNPVTARWYADRGIPYRRGYLFYGPPGTGKTSLTFALSGFFGLDIYGVSLLDPMLTEEELEILFTSLPARCIILLEDIDTAGLIREQSKSEETAAPLAGDEKGGNELNVATFAKALQKASLLSEEEKKKTISLSGLLNVIDGIFLTYTFFFLVLFRE